jgi:DNA-binding transcriptional regulator YiaG
MPKANVEPKEESKGKRGSKSASITDTYTGAKSDIGIIVASNAKHLFTSPCKDESEMAERLNDFFETHIDNDNFPTVEKMALCLGIDRTTLWRWEQGNGCTAVQCAMIRRAKEILAGIDAELVSRRKIPETTYIFRAKNFHQMRDVVDHNINTTNTLEATENIDDIRAKYMLNAPE